MATNRDFPVERNDLDHDDNQPTATINGVSSKLKERQNADDKSESKSKKKAFLAIKTVFGILFFSMILLCTVFSKLTLVSLTDTLRIIFLNDTELNFDDRSRAVSIYWQLLLVLIIPSFITLIRSLVLGVLGKTRENFPWPKLKSFIAGAIGSILEVGAMSVFVFLVLAELPPDTSLFLLSGVFICQIAVDIWYVDMCTCCNSQCARRTCRQGYQQVGAEEGLANNLDQDAQVLERRIRKPTLIKNFFKMLLENKFIKMTAFFIQAGSLIVFIALCYNEFEVKIIVLLPICLLVLSATWTNKFQDWIAEANTSSPDNVKTARFKSSFINSIIRVLLYPVITYLVFRFATPHKIDPLCLSNMTCPTGIDFSGDTLPVFLVQILTSLVAYITAWVACTMTLGPYSMAGSLMISTPLSFACYYVILYFRLSTFPPFSNPVTQVYHWGSIILAFLWVGQLLGIGFYIFTKRNNILSRDADMFLTPHYDAVFLEQQMILNRQTRKYKQRPDNMRGAQNDPVSNPQQRYIFVCTTMYRENVEEMKEILMSINGIAKQYEIDRKQNSTSDTYESHIFFDGALNRTQLLEFGLQLLSLLEDIFGIKPEEGGKNVTPYGLRLTYQLNDVHHMPFHIHFKDKNLVKPKKRWSQVMYMNYVIRHRIETHNPADGEQKMTLDNTFILTTDADINFTPKSVLLLLDMLKSNPQVGAVCARTHPKGSGPLYWYQIFDYAIGHWFQKPAEHLLGCVLCSPGCFSVFKCSALESVLKDYSSEVTSGMEFLMKNMGEDRWLCTLLIKHHWRLEYCATSQCRTYCPQSFDEFYAQRRRWIPSTLANLSVLFTEMFSITKKNDSVSVLFILFQAVMIWSTAISPATVILVIITGLQAASANYETLYISDAAVFSVIAVLVAVSIVYGFICLFSSPKTQLQVAKILTFLFVIIMVVVICGVVSHIVNSLIYHPNLFPLKAPNCTILEHTSSYEKCEEVANLLRSLISSNHFKLPVSISTIYVGLFAVLFSIAALMHPTEFTCLFHCIWYLLAFPSGYLLLMIYSAANLDSQSWGTREMSSGEDEGLLGWMKYLKKAWYLCCIQSRCCRPDTNPGEGSQEIEMESVQGDSEDEEQVIPMACKMDRSARDWLTGEDCECDEWHVSQFEEEGYTTLHYISAMTLEDFKAVGIKKRGIRLRLFKAAKKLPSFPIQVDVPRDVASWLRKLKMEEYTELFKREGYSKKSDVEHLKGLTEFDLKAMGITKRAHIQRLMKALHYLAYPNKMEQKMAKTKANIELLRPAQDMDEREERFWANLISDSLEPVPQQLTPVKNLKESLRNLRNGTLIALFLINMMWILVLYIIKFPILGDYGLETRAFQLLFLAVYGIIIVVQFIAMIFHRGITLVHTFGRITPKEVEDFTTRDDFVTLDVDYEASRSIN